MTRIEVIQEAKRIVAFNPIYLDTETTGFQSTAQIVEIAIVDSGGQVLLDSRIHPTFPIPPDATGIHGITDADVEDAPSFLNVAPAVFDLLHERVCVIYNSAFDSRMLKQSANLYQASRGMFDGHFAMSCAMCLYADFLQEGGKWQKLGNAARQCHIPVPERLHGAAVDAKLTREIMLYMASVLL
ncbi:MAG: 3'-5' exonuclease [bacterium]